MTVFLIAFVAALLAMAVIDGLWLGLVARTILSAAIATVATGAVLILV